jgi:formylglycine-generating enzyme required for sulfatase activity
MNRVRNLLVLPLAAACAALFVECSTDSRRDTFEYLRSPVSFRIDPVSADHPFCFDGNARPAGMTESQCRALSKFRMSWERPEDTVGLAEYRIYLDTTPPNATLPWSLLHKQRAFASFVIEGAAPASDSLIFFLADTGATPRVITRGQPGLLALDTTGRRDSTGKLIFGIATGYSESGLDGLPRLSWIITDDRFAPGPIQSVITPKAKTIEIAWDRPRDPTSFFEPGADSGIILAYYLRIVRSGQNGATRPGTFDPTVTYVVGGVNRTAEVDSTHFRIRNAPGRVFRLPDSSRVRNRLAGDPLDSIKVVISGLPPQDTVDIALWAVDVAGNLNPTDTGLDKTYFLTDTTQPTTPSVRVTGSTRNGFAYAFTASRDLVETGSGLAAASNPNANILEYRVTRRRLSGPGGGPVEVDTTITVRASQRGDTLFRDTARYLSPGGTYRLTVRAVDSTGYVSDADTITVSTTAAVFPGIDSASTCPSGFVAVPGGFFKLGDSVSTDEAPRVRRYMQSFCIEPYEHKDSTGAFATRKTWEQARDACSDLSASLTLADSTWLCTEAEWERACEGVENDVPLTYGMQSERVPGASVRYTCNVGTGDSTMAFSPSLRDPRCVSYDGVFDMAGNLAEWVLDPYAKSGYPATPDTLRRGVPHTPVTTASVRGFRGNYYLNPNESPTTLLSRARCSNRDYATQSRPLPYAGCIDSAGPQIAVTYASKPPRCLPLPGNIAAASVDTIVPALDSTKLLILLKGDASPRTYQMPLDTAYAHKGIRPATAGLTRQTLAIVTFVNAQTSATVTDTLNATELLGRSEAERALIFAREAAPPWSVAKSGGVYAIRYLYAHVQTRNAVAKAYYSNSAMGFRCCAKPRP